MHAVYEHRLWIPTNLGLSLDLVSYSHVGPARYLTSQAGFLFGKTGIITVPTLCKYY